MTSFRASLVASIAELDPGQIEDVMGYIASRGRYLGRLQRWVCLKAHDMACARRSMVAKGQSAADAREAATAMLRRRKASRWSEPLTQIIECGRVRIGETFQPYDWSGPRLMVAGHQFNVRDLLAGIKPEPVAKQQPMQLDLFGGAA